MIDQPIKRNLISKKIPFELQEALLGLKNKTDLSGIQIMRRLAVNINNNPKIGLTFINLKNYGSRKKQGGLNVFSERW